MVAGLGRSRDVVVEAVGAPSVVQVILIRSTMPLVRAALCHHLNLSARRTVKVGRLIVRSHLEFFDTVRRRRHNSGRTSATWAPAWGRASHYGVYQAAGWVARKAGSVGVLGAVHVAGVIAAIEHKGVLILVRAPHASVRSDSGLQSHKRADIAPQPRKVIQWYASQCITNGCARGVEGDASGIHFHSFNV